MSDIIWKGSPNHYVGRNGYGITHITLHIMVGYLAGTDSTFANQSSRASAHYGIGATGEIHQYVSELDGSYSDANYASNNSTISIEHEAAWLTARYAPRSASTQAPDCAPTSREGTDGKNCGTTA